MKYIYIYIYIYMCVCVCVCVCVCEGGEKERERVTDIVYSVTKLRVGGISWDTWENVIL